MDGGISWGKKGVIHLGKACTMYSFDYTPKSQGFFLGVFIMSVLSVFGAMLLPKLALPGPLPSLISNYTMDSISITRTIYGSCIPFSSTSSIPSYSFLNRGGIATKYRSVGARTARL
jgi:hypothetical protein